MRTQRKLSFDIRERISNSMKGKKKSKETKDKISKSMKKYWENIPYENKEENC